MQSSATTDADILNFALNLEVRLSNLWSTWLKNLHLHILASLINRFCGVAVSGGSVLLLCMVILCQTT